MAFGVDSKIALLGDEAFSGDYTKAGCPITEIFIPDSVKRIGRRCFYNCRRLSRVIIGPSSSLTEFGDEAFSGQYSEACPITEIFIPDSVEIIGSGCFYKCRKLQQVTLGSSPSIQRVGSYTISWSDIREHRDSVSKFEYVKDIIERGAGLQEGVLITQEIFGL